VQPPRLQLQRIPSGEVVDYIRTLWYIWDMKVLNLRGVPVDLVRRAKSAAALQGITLREFVFKAIEEKLKKAK
jgi:hypothetical protein